MDANILAEAGYENAVGVNFCPVTLSLPRYHYLFSLLSAISFSLYSVFITHGCLWDVSPSQVHVTYPPFPLHSPLALCVGYWDSSSVLVCNRFQIMINFTCT